MYRVDRLIPGYPGKTTSHGSLGWGSVALLRGEGQTIVIEPGDDLEWALGEPPGLSGVPEFHVRQLAEDDRIRRVADATQVLPGITAIATPGHTPGHMAYRVTGEDNDYLFTGDAAKNRAELLSGSVDISRDLPTGKKSLSRLLEVARDDPSNVVVCGHDAAFRIGGDRAIAVQEQDAGMIARLSTDFDDETFVSLTGPHPVRRSPVTPVR